MSTNDLQGAGKWMSRVVKKSQATFRMCVNIFQHFVPNLQAFSFPLLTVVF